MFPLFEYSSLPLRLTVLDLAEDSLSTVAALSKAMEQAFYSSIALPPQPRL